jgi:hypothetical protein
MCISVVQKPCKSNINFHGTDEFSYGSYVIEFTVIYTRVLFLNMLYH